MLTDPQHEFSLLSFIKRIVSGHYHSNSIIVVAMTIFLSIWAIMAWKQKRVLPQLFWKMQIAICCVSMIKPFIRISTIPCYSLLGAFGISVLPLMIHFTLTIKHAQEKLKEIILLYWLGIVVALSFSVGSNTGFDAMLTGYCLCAMAGILLLRNVFRDDNPESVKL